MKNIKINPFIYFFIIILYLETLIKYVINPHLLHINLLYLIIFSAPISLLFTVFTKSFSKKVNTVILIIISLILTIYFEIQYIFFTLFSTPFSFSTIGLANQALDFTDIIKETISSHLLFFALFFLPFIIIVIFHKFINCEKYSKTNIISLIIMFITSYLSTFLFLLPLNENTKNISNLYFHVNNESSIIDCFGLLTYTKIDIKRQFLKYDSTVILEEPKEIEILPQTEESIEYGHNQIDLNLDRETKNSQIKTLNNYFKNKQPSEKNKYTGMFENKNLIFILAEGFNEIAVDKERTPTLYKLTNSGFVFEDFYSPVFLSTTGGEFQAMTGLIPTQEILSNWKNKTPKISYALGNVFQEKNYQVQSYHNWSYKYYKRNKTMETLGFHNYIGCGNGLEKRMSCKWLPSDIDMINSTTSDYLNKDKNFMTFYVTVSGHSPYNDSDNIAKKYLDLLKDTNYSNPVKYYLASQVELDRMLEQLIKNLEEANELDNTVIALVGDHYPYTLSTSQMNEVSNYQKDGTIEVNHSNFILWNSTMEEKITINKIGSQIDVLPTLLNLFAINYDSRLIIGQDLLSNYEGLAIFSNRSWISDYGSYNSLTKTFTLRDGKTLEDEAMYIKNINNRVANSFTISKLIIDNNYYNYILN